MQRAQELLEQTFGYESFRHHQADIIQTLLDDKDALVLMPTGGGKSLCYQIPALVREGTGIVISPLIALMQDQVDALKQVGIRAAYLNSTQDFDTQKGVVQDLLNNQLDLLYVAPERLLSSRMLQILEQAHIGLFAIDEAHCVSQWGHDFRKDYQQLYILHERFPNVPRIALTATADKRTREEIISQLGLQDARVFVNSFDRPNIHYTVSDGQNAKERLWQFIQREHAGDAGIVYCLSRKSVDSVAKWLSDKGRIALPYHAGMSPEMRALNQKRFLREEGVIVVATIAFGMGIDKPDVRFVAHLNLPKSIESYYQETGRAGRDGRPANAWMNYGLQDIITLRQMSQDSDADENYKRISHHKLETMIGLCETTHCRRQSLLAYFDEKLDEPCGNCDTCNSPPQTWDATELSRKALSCIYRTGQQFGVNYVIDVLMGKDDERIKKNGHDSVSTFSIGAEISGAEWRSIFRQLIARGLIAADMQRYGALYLTDEARPLLRGEQEIHLRKLQTKEKVTSKKNRKSELRSIDETLFEALREKRAALAQEQGVPPYIIFHDATLVEIAKSRPANENELRYISGVGEQKLKRFGAEFLTVVKQHALPDLLNNSLSNTVNETLYLYSQGKSVDEIAKQRELNASTVYTHLADAIEVGLLDPADVLPLEEGEIDEIIYAIEMSDDDRLKPIYESLDGAYDYGVIKCVQAAM